VTTISFLYKELSPNVFSNPSLIQPTFSKQADITSIIKDFPVLASPIKLDYLN
jgi:hypothetical protein